MTFSKPIFLSSYIVLILLTILSHFVLTSNLIMEKLFVTILFSIVVLIYAFAENFALKSPVHPKNILFLILLIFPWIYNNIYVPQIIIISGVIFIEILLYYILIKVKFVNDYEEKKAVFLYQKIHKDLSVVTFMIFGILKSDLILIAFLMLLFQYCLFQIMHILYVSHIKYGLIKILGMFLPILMAAILIVLIILFPYYSNSQDNINIFFFLISLPIVYLSMISNRKLYFESIY